MPELDGARELNQQGLLGDRADLGWDRPAAPLVEAEAAVTLSASDCAVALVPIATPAA